MVQRDEEIPAWDTLKDHEKALYARQMEVFAGMVDHTDAQIGRLMAALRDLDVLDDTVVMITSDHGEEFGESSAKLERHGSGYTRYQLVIPMVLAWPGRGLRSRHAGRHQHALTPTIANRLGFDLADTFAGNFENPPDFFQRVAATVLEAKAQAENARFAWGEGA